jgi:hypothetical protein
VGSLCGMDSLAAKWRSVVDRPQRRNSGSRSSQGRRGSCELWCSAGGKSNQIVYWSRLRRKGKNFCCFVVFLSGLSTRSVLKDSLTTPMDNVGRPHSLSGWLRTPFCVVAACLSLGVRRCDNDYCRRAHIVRRTWGPPAEISWSQNSRQGQSDGEQIG